MSELKKRYLMRHVVGALVLLVCVVFSAAVYGSDTPTKPDILMIMPDQMRGDCLSVLEHPTVETPQLDSLAKNGVLFRRAYTPVASCIPARYALLTGLHPMTSGVVGYRGKKFSTPPFPELLAQAGYVTALVGRNMHQVPANGSCGYTLEIQSSTYESDDDYDRYLKKQAPESGGIRAIVKREGLDNNRWPAKPWPLADELHPTEWIIQQSRKVVDQTPPEKRLFLTASFYAPHPPLFPPKKYFDKYMKKEQSKPARGNWVDWKSLTTKGTRNGHRILLQGKKLQRAQAGYFGLIEHLDTQFGPLIAEFKARSERAGRPWVIVFTSDHGEMMGDHGYFRKCEPYEGAANIPFIVAGSPELGFKTGSRVQQPVCLEDIMPTLLGLAGVECPSYVDGVDLVRTLQGKEQVVRDWLHFEHAPCYGQAQAYHALTDGRFKYIWRPRDGREQLFDLVKDPKEEHDLTGDEAAGETLKTCRAKLIERLKDRPEGFVEDGKLVSGRVYKPLNQGTLPVKASEK